jgi:hypothetical protein
LKIRVVVAVFEKKFDLAVDNRNLLCCAQLAGLVSFSPSMNCFGEQGFDFMAENNGGKDKARSPKLGRIKRPLCQFESCIHGIAQRYLLWFEF